MCKSNKIINLSNYKSNNKNIKFNKDEDELFEIDVGSFIKDLESGKYENIKELLKDYKNN